MTAVHQFVPTFAPFDAIGRHTLELRGVLRDLGMESDIYAAEIHPELADEAQPYTRYERNEEQAWLVYHASTGSPVASFVAKRPPTLLAYHNITPPEFFTGWDPQHARRLREGRRQIAGLASSSELGFADSAFNATDLRHWGCPEVVVAPVLFDPARVAPDPATTRLLAAEQATGGSDWLFVGRLAPNKAQHDLVSAFALYREAYDSLARLHLVGDASVPAYRDALVRFVAAAGLDGAVRFHDRVQPAELAALYSSADVFVCLSRHEGFCVPLLEAMQHELPIVAHDAGAIGETLCSAGLLLGRRDAPTFAAAVARVLRDAALRGALRERGRARAAALSLARTRDLYVDAFQRLVATSS